MSGETALLDWLRERLGDDSPIGDDAALLSLTAGDLAITVDQQIEGVHFPAGTDPAVVARRLLAVNLSDLAAVGAEPRHAFLSLAASRELDHRRFFRALTDACDQHGTTLAGGDLARLPRSGLATSLTLIGERSPGSGWVRRRGARPGDDLWVGGTLGESALGRHLLARGARARGQSARPRIELPQSLELPPPLARAARRAIRRHLLPTPQLALGGILARRAAERPERPPAAIDVSDGLAIDLGRLCAASGVGADLSLRDLPRPDGFEALADRLGLDPQELSLAGGEDYVLLFTGTKQNAPEGCTWIGRVRSSDTSPGALRAFADGIENGNGKPLPHAGWDHLAD